MSELKIKLEAFEKKLLEAMQTMREAVDLLDGLHEIAGKKSGRLMVQLTIGDGDGPATVQHVNLTRVP